MSDLNSIKRDIERDGEFSMKSNHNGYFFDNNSSMIYIFRKNKSGAERIVYVFKRNELTYSALESITERTKNKKHFTEEQKEDRILLMTKLVSFRRRGSLKKLLNE